MAVEHTGGMSVQSDTFHNPVFKDSFKRVFAAPGEEGHMGIASCATLEVRQDRQTAEHRRAAEFCQFRERAMLCTPNGTRTGAASLAGVCASPS